MSEINMIFAVCALYTFNGFMLGGLLIGWYMNRNEYTESNKE